MTNRVASARCSPPPGLRIAGMAAAAHSPPPRIAPPSSKDMPFCLPFCPFLFLTTKATKFHEAFFLSLRFKFCSLSVTAQPT
jgi:hypothetical protein